MEHHQVSQRTKIRRIRFGYFPSERGSLTVVAAACLTIAIIVLGSIDIGYQFWVHRQLQAIADASALSAVQEVTADTGCMTSGTSSGLVTSTASNAATKNGFGGTPTTVCGTWTPSSQSGGTFQSGTAPSSSNSSLTPAVRVTVSEQIPYFFMGPSRTLTATATAHSTAIDAFSLSSTIAELSGGIVNSLLQQMICGSANCLGLAVGSYQGLATAQVNLGVLAAKLGIADPTKLLTTSITIAQLATAEAAAVSAEGLANVNVSVLNTIATKVNSSLPTVTLGQILSLGSSNVGALAGNVNALDLIMGAAYVANGSNAISIPSLSVTLPTGVSITASMSLIQPPTYGVGQANQVTVHSQSGSLDLEIKAPSLSVLGVSVNLDLPIHISIAPSTAVLTAVQCTTSKSATFQVTPGILTACIGTNPSFVGNTYTCSGLPAPLVSLAPTTLLTELGLGPLNGLVTALTQLLGLGNGNVTIGINPTSGIGAGLTAQPVSMTFPATTSECQASDNVPDYCSTNTNAVGASIANLLPQIVTDVTTGLYVTVGGAPVTDATKLPTVIQSLLTNLVSQVLSPIMNDLDTTLVPALSALGLQLGIATVHAPMSGMTCSSSLVQ